MAQWVKEVHDGRHGRGGRSGHGEPSTSSMRSMSSTMSISSAFPEIAANAALVLIAVACSLLDRQIAAQSKAFEEEGGFSERLYRVRTARRRR